MFLVGKEVAIRGDMCSGGCPSFVLLYQVTMADVAKCLSNTHFFSVSEFLFCLRFQHSWFEILPSPECPKARNACMIQFGQEG